jgi:glycosyltransferase involved in cell wall biosynthesis
MANISILILTKNEQADLPGCLKSVFWSDDIHIYDSMSTDNTIAIAKDFGAKITRRNYYKNKLAFGGDESAHRNWGLSKISFKYPWVFVMDADERMTRELVDAAIDAIQSKNNTVAFRVVRRDFLNGIWLKHAQASPYYIRLFQPKKIHYERLINPTTIVNGEIGEISGYLDHFPFSKGIGHWFEKHNFYSQLEAEQIIKNKSRHISFSLYKVFFLKDFNERRFHQKELFYRLPFRPFLKFIILYFVKRGFLDGSAGFQYAVLQSIYEYFIVLKTRELEKKLNK